MSPVLGFFYAALTLAATSLPELYYFVNNQQISLGSS